MRVAKFEKGSKDFADGLLQVLDITDADQAIGILMEFYPNSVADAEKTRFVLKHIMATERSLDAPQYPR